MDSYQRYQGDNNDAANTNDDDFAAFGEGGDQNDLFMQ